MVFLFFTDIGIHMPSTLPQFFMELFDIMCTCRPIGHLHEEILL